MTGTSDTERRMYGGFWIRTAAFVLDFIIVTVLVFLIGGGVSSILFLLGIEETSFVHVLALLCPLILWFVVPWMYCVLWETSKVKATPGKLVLSLIVVDKEGKRLEFWHASGRYWIKAITFTFIHIIYIVVAFTPKKQGAHDLCTNTFVVHKKELQRYNQQSSLL
ncbi:RDD family protein [Paenibacillus polymyxa]|uniref:RDD family protein n=1 Tax=Paenibacillus polymyxa TaxID=1406 RepID=UPI002024DD3F|nr:RDD family protein [Paenibacillus polymyxa]URJ52176.3 RDD family protein [Paenibacillus polymyxa]